MKRKIRVLVVDDSAIVRKILSEALSAEEDIEVVGTAPDPYIARDKILALKPDVLTLDIEMPRMDGLSFLRRIMQYHPMPVIIISSLAHSGCSAALQALEIGAVEALGKPGGPFSVGELRLVLANKVRAAALARLPSRSEPAQPDRILPVAKAPVATRAVPGLILIGASTGGTEAIREILKELPEHCPPILIVQHIPPVFSKAFADRLNQTCRLHVKEAADGDSVRPGEVLIAPGDFHMILRRNVTGLIVQVKTGQRICYQRPSVDVLFQSAAELAGKKTVAALLTGMGNDGAAGLLKLRQAGVRTIAQDEASCVVYGMPREAARLEAAEQILPLRRIAAAICAAVEIPQVSLTRAGHA